MKMTEYEKFEDFSRLFGVYCSGIDSHFNECVPNREYVVNSLLTMKDILDNIIESCRPMNNNEREYAASVCDNCIKAHASKSQAELDAHCRICSHASKIEGRC